MHLEHIAGKAAANDPAYFILKYELLKQIIGGSNVVQDIKQSH